MLRPCAALFITHSPTPISQQLLGTREARGARRVRRVARCAQVARRARLVARFPPYDALTLTQQIYVVHHTDCGMLTFKDR